MLARILISNKVAHLYIHRCTISSAPLLVLRSFVKKTTSVIFCSSKDRNVSASECNTMNASNAAVLTVGSPNRVHFISWWRLMMRNCCVSPLQHLSLVSRTLPEARRPICLLFAHMYLCVLMCVNPRSFSCYHFQFHTHCWYLGTRQLL